jgi:hypothetical protein
VSHTVYRQADVNGVSVFYRPGRIPAGDRAPRQRHVGSSPSPEAYDPSFLVAEAEAYRRDVPTAKVHLLDAGHFALDEQPDQVAELTRQFLRPSIPLS